jgi:acetoin utilization deacetylase AcuC-like enzyme
MCGIFQHPFYPFSGDQHPASNMVNVPVPAYTKGMDIREIVEMMWIPRLEAFKPELIFISAGFDAHREDDMGPRGMTAQAFTWITSRVKDIARRFSKGRIVSCLEGGYVMGPLARSVEAHVRVLADL